MIDVFISTTFKVLTKAKTPSSIGIVAVINCRMVIYIKLH